MNKNITPFNDKGQPHGYWEYYWENGKLHFKCVYINGETNGFEELYCDNDGKLRIKSYHL